MLGPRTLTVALILSLLLACGTSDGASDASDALEAELDAAAPLGCAMTESGALACDLGGAEARLDPVARTLKVIREDGASILDLDLTTVAFRRGEATYEIKTGMARVEETAADDWRFASAIVDLAVDGAGSASFALMGTSGVALATGRLSAPVDGQLDLVLEAVDTALNRAALGFACALTDHFAGLGAQTHDVDHRGQLVPLYVSEQGIGKVDTDELPAVWFLTGRRHTSHVPIPAVTTSRGTAWALDTKAYALFDLCATDEGQVRLEAWERTLRFRFFDGPTPLEALGRFTAWVGRPPVPVPWAFAPWNDGVYGSEAVRAFAHFLRDEEIPSSAIWSEDWRGGAWYGENYRLDQDWQLDRALYPDFEELMDDLRALGLMSQVYFNTFLFLNGDVYDEAIAGGHAVVDTAGEPIVFNAPDANLSLSALADLSQEETQEWVKGYLRAALDLGARGWMADYAEWMPVEDMATDHELPPDQLHNLYPLLWQTINNEVVAEAGLEDEVCVFVRSGHLGSQPLVSVMWAADQQTSFRADDGLPTIIPIGLGLAATGFPYYAHDVAGYQSETNAPPKFATKELFFRWTELGALSPVMRTHHGIAGSNNWNLQSDAESTDHWRRYARLHIQLYPYLRGLAMLARDEGRSLWLPMGLLHPEDEAVWPLMDQLYLGEALLVAPVVTEGAVAREVTFPAGRFARVFGEPAQVVEGPGVVEVPAPLSEIPVFIAAGGLVPLTAEPVMTLLNDVPDMTDLSDTEGDRLLYVGLGADGVFVEESGARYELVGEGTSTEGLSLDADGGVTLTGDAILEGSGWTLTLSGHPEDRKTHVRVR